MPNYRLPQSIISHKDRLPHRKHPKRYHEETETSSTLAMTPCPSCNLKLPKKRLCVPKMWGYDLAYCVNCYGNQQFRHTMLQEFVNFSRANGRPKTANGAQGYGFRGTKTGTEWATKLAADALPCYMTFMKHAKVEFGNKTKLKDVFDLCVDKLGM